MTNYYCSYDNGLLNRIHDYIEADSEEEAKEAFIRIWGVAKPDLVKIQTA